MNSLRRAALRMRPRRRQAHDHHALPDGQLQLLPVLDGLGHCDRDRVQLPAVSDCDSCLGGWYVVVGGW
jgi:hypothetical protein